MRDQSVNPRTPWIDEVSDALLGFATENVRNDGLVRPALAAFRDGRDILVAWLRPFARGAYADPVIEVAALALPLGANQLAVLMGARAWSLDDPVAPVVDDVDLRQRVAMVTAADGSRSPVVTATTLQPHDVGARSAVRIHERVELSAGEGWLSGALGVFVSHSERYADFAARERLARQAARVIDLGHDVWLHPDAACRVARADVGQ